MAKRKRKATSIRLSVRLPDDVHEALAHLERTAGWSHAAGLAWLSRAGVDAMYGGGRGAEAMRQLLSLAIDAHHAEKLAESTVGHYRAKLRSAQKAVRTALVAPAELAEKPPADAPIIRSGRKRGRPRKSPVPPAGASGAADVSEAGQGSENAPALH